MARGRSGTGPDPHLRARADIRGAVTAASRTFETQDRRVFSPKEIEVLVTSHRVEWNVPGDISARRFIDLLTSMTDLRRIEIPPLDVDTRKSFSRFVWGEVSPYALALSLRPGSYLSHASAVFLHGLTDQIPKTIYANKEQSEKPKPTGGLTQEAVDRAFRNQPRESTYTFAFGDYRVTLLSGKNTSQLEVSEIESAGERLRATKLERTLIDIAVRPNYAGGVGEVLAAYTTARPRVSVNTLVATLKQLDYVYPYQQAIGFYMERAGFDPKQLDKVRAMKTPINFYLFNRMDAPALSSAWNVYYPRDLR